MAGATHDGLMNATARMTPTQRIQLGVAAWDRNDFMEALEIFDGVLRESPRFPDVHNRLGLCKAMLGNSEGALAAFDKALELAPTFAEAHFNRGIVLNDLGRHDEAQEAFEQAHQLDTRDGTRFPSQVGNQIANSHAETGHLYMKAESWMDAAEQYRAALKVRPRYGDVREKLAEALLAAGDAHGAKVELERVLSERPGFAEARIKLGVALQRLGDREGAVREWKQVYAVRPEDLRVRGYLASAGVVVEAAS
jgi:Flp pilus assembly protein TadD